LSVQGLPVQCLSVYQLYGIFFYCFCTF
jgi:hypothetical protein